MPIIKKFCPESDESIFIEIFTNCDGGITFYCRNENTNESFPVDLEYEDIDELIDEIYKIKREIEQNRQEVKNG